MGIIAKQSIQGTIVTYLGVAVGFVTTFFVLTRFLSAEEIGLARVLVDAATLFIGLAQLGTSSSIIRFYPHFKHSVEPCRMVQNSLELSSTENTTLHHSTQPLNNSTPLYTTMTVKEVFELRREGKIEEAYQTILPMYKVHHGKYTTLAMFWCAVDMLKLLLGRVAGNDSESLHSLTEAEKIYLSLQRLYPHLKDDEGVCQQTLLNLGEALRATRQRAQQ